MSETVILDPNEIQVGERQRKEFSEGELKALKASIEKHGQLQEIGITYSKRLIWGERRLRVMKELGMPVRCRVFSKEEFSEEDLGNELKLFRLEYAENMARSNLTAKEEILANAKMHELLEETAKEDNLVWSLRDSANELGISKSSMQSDYEAALFLKTVPEQFEDCTSKTEIRSRVKLIKGQMKYQRNQEKIEKTIKESGEAILSVPFTEGVTIKVPDPAEIAPTIKEVREQVSPRITLTKEDLLERKLKEFHGRLNVGDYREYLPKIQDDVIGVMFLDPPWGVNLHEKADAGFLKGRRYKDYEEDFFKQFPSLCRLCYEKMKEDSHLYCFFSIQFHEFVYKCLEKAGFMVNRRPIIIKKEGRSSTRVPEIWRAACYEPIAFARKGNRPLNIKGQVDCETYKWLTPSEKKGHISAKPPTLYADLLRASALPGDFVCDPMYGSGAAFIGCEMLPELHLQWFGWDVDEDNKAAALMSLTELLMKGGIESE